MRFLLDMSTRSLVVCFALVLTSAVLFPNQSEAQISNRGQLYFQQMAGVNGVATNSVSAQVAHRIFLDEDGANLLTLGLGFTQTKLEDDRLSGAESDRDLRTVVPTANLMKILNDEYSLVATLRTGFYGSLEGSLGDDFRVEGGVVVTKFITDSLTMGLGIGRGTNFGRDMVVPLVQILWFASDSIIVRGLLPVNASVWYIPSPEWEFGFIYRLNGSLYNLDNTNVAGAEQLGFAAAHVGLAARRNLWNTNFLEFEAGFTGLRRYEFNNEEKINFIAADDPFFIREVDNVPYVRFGWIQKF